MRRAAVLLLVLLCAGQATACFPIAPFVADMHVVGQESQQMRPLDHDFSDPHHCGPGVAPMEMVGARLAWVGETWQVLDLETGDHWTGHGREPSQEAPSVSDHPGSYWPGWELGLTETTLYAVADSRWREPEMIHAIEFRVGSESIIPWPFDEEDGIVHISGATLWFHSMFLWSDEAAFWAYDLENETMLLDGVIPEGLPSGARLYTTDTTSGAIRVFAEGDGAPSGFLLLPDGTVTHEHETTRAFAKWGSYTLRDDVWHPLEPGQEQLGEETIIGQVYAADRDYAVLAVSSYGAADSSGDAPDGPTAVPAPLPWSLALVVLGVLGASVWSRSRR